MSRPKSGQGSRDLLEPVFNFRRVSGLPKLGATLSARIALGSVFIYASIGKITNPIAFATIVHNYQILPPFLVNPTALVLPWLELVTGLLLILGVWLPGAVVLTNGLLMTFFSTLVFNVARGLNVSCGCFSTHLEEAPQSLWYLIRDGLFLLLGGYLLFRTLIKKSSRMDEKG